MSNSWAISNCTGATKGPGRVGRIADPRNSDGVDSTRARRCEFSRSTAVRRRSSTRSSTSSRQASARPRAGASIGSGRQSPTTPRRSARCSTRSTVGAIRSRRPSGIASSTGARSTPARRASTARSSTSLRQLVAFAPLHLPPEIDAMEAVARHWPDRPQVACFDTAFHRTLSAVAQRYALPEREDREGLRRYGFHGLSYEYVVAEVGAATLGRSVLAHLGNGASMAAVRDGRSVDTTMGFSPTGGLVMGTRLGDADPGLLVHWLQPGRDAKRPRRSRQPAIGPARGQRDDGRRAGSARAARQRSARSARDRRLHVECAKMGGRDGGDARRHRHARLHRRHRRARGRRPRRDRERARAPRRPYRRGAQRTLRRRRERRRRRVHRARGEDRRGANGRPAHKARSCRRTRGSRRSPRPPRRGRGRRGRARLRDRSAGSSDRCRTSHGARCTPRRGTPAAARSPASRRAPSARSPSC